MTAVGAVTNQARTILKDSPFGRIIVVIVTLVGLRRREAFNFSLEWRLSLCPR